MEPYEKEAHAKANRRVPKYTGAEDPWTRRTLESVRDLDDPKLEAVHHSQTQTHTRGDTLVYRGRGSGRRSAGITRR